MTWSWSWSGSGGSGGPGSKDPDSGSKDPSWRGSGRGPENRVFWPMSSLSKAF